MADIRMREAILTTAIFEVFEKMFYLFAEPLRGGGGNYQMTSSIRFEGPSTGTMELSLSRDIAAAMVQNMLNLEGEEITEAMMADCVKEAINMICGNFVRRLDPEKVFQLSIPSFTMGSAPADGRESAQDRLCLAFTAEGGYIEVAVRSAELPSAGRQDG
jgi:CheY-specific phosphatase CheX